jgi:hypothetical protein
MNDVVYITETKPPKKVKVIKKLIACHICERYLTEEQIYNHLKSVGHKKKKVEYEKRDQEPEMSNIISFKD